MKNLEIAKILNNIADILELQGVDFKPQAYRKAARSIEALTEDIQELYNQNKLTDIPGVGESIAKKIIEYLKTGKIKYYQKLKKGMKIDVEELNLIPGLGPKKIKLLYQKLKIKNIHDLEKAIQKKKIEKISGFSAETEKNLQQGINFVKKKPQRYLYAQVLPIVNEITNYFKKLSFVQKIEVAGSFRRRSETVGDLDFVIVSKEPEKVMKAFVSLPDVQTVLAKGTAKSSVQLKNGLQIDVRVFPEKELGSALNYFIGSKLHNIELRKFALTQGYTLSEYGLFKLKNKQWLAGRTEQEIYQKLGLKYIEPELRENLGEIEAAKSNKLPHLIEDSDLLGIFHNHTNWSDGANSMLKMAKKAQELKFKFISFNDHFGNVGVSNPLNEKRLTKYLHEIEQVQKKVNLKVFSGIEIDILKNGTLPLTKEKLKKIDVVIASVHLATKMPEKEMTARVCSALEKYPINILGHPTDRLINSRTPINLNLNKVFETAQKNHVFLEVNSSPQRMDLSFQNVKSAIESGCNVAVGTDAHDSNSLNNYHFGILNCRKGWAEKKNVLNCWPLPKISKALEK